ncbi:MAG TPA: M20/M25/M40 family metallo-hydrolase [Vicinamibacterales bacterium]|nr:M20/M25/M40 family metallo-hydrolase [Vicinamibacterales bacterium]
MTHRLLIVVSVVALSGSLQGQTQGRPDSAALEEETLRHFQALLRLDTSNPSGNEVLAVDYLKQVLDKEGIATQVFASDLKRPNLVARITGNGSKRPILVMGHTDVVTVDPKKWTHPPFGAVRDGGYVYGRGAVDDKDNVAAGLMLMLMLKRGNVPLDRDVIFLAEAGEEGTPQVGAQFMIDHHLDAIDAEFCLAEGGGVVRTGGQVVRANVGTTEKEPRAVELVARGPAGHGSVPQQSNAVALLTGAVAKIVAWTPPLRVTETTGSYFRALAAMASPEAAQRYRDVLNPDPSVHKPAAIWMLQNEPQHWSMLHTSLVPTILEGGYRYNVIPSEARATIDVRLHPDEDQTVFLDEVRKVIDDPRVEVRWARDRYRPAGASSLTTEAFTVIQEHIKKHYGTFVLPTMSTGATDMAQIRSKGIQCYGIGPAIDSEDAGKGFGAHSDQERILERELHRFVGFQYDVVIALAASR